MDSVVQISASGAAVLVVGLLGLVFGFGRILLSQFENRVAARDEAADELARAERDARSMEMRDLRGSIANEARRIGTLSEQIGALLEVDKRLRVIEEWRKHVPTDDDIDQVKATLAIFGRQLGAVEERSATTLNAVNRIEQYLLEQK